MKTGPKITFDELMSEVDKIEGIRYQYRISLTEEQKKFLIKCREKKSPPLSYTQIKVLWDKMGWNKVTVEMMRRYYHLAKGVRL